ncbi:hypothetical protein HYH02_013695 [Chlamydomonas schloesseri]|uniref:Uncharacterized protein n=1 Tax=Chlamydomonas schloesseri TaxID=2026947 RepID=A0A835SVN3_9CHLO|nr:hypothetical protein HYH02_013695 [Chlamydomonas schloesseri]|eukprot:KAG2430698.1 hypothetical protein HYH02_013695 [Chlamydomonas schloesseri]
MQCTTKSFSRSSARKAFGTGRSRSAVVVVKAVHRGQPQQQAPAADVPRRSLLLSSLASAAAAAAASLAAPLPAAAGDPVTEFLRGYTRPEVGLQEAVVILMDARSTLKEIQALAATPEDSEERFRARALWPAFAKRLRAVAEAAPVAVAAVTGAADKEETLGEMYGGKAGGSGAADAVYAALGAVLTISGRTIRPEAQAGPEAAAAAESAITGFLSKLPASLVDEAQAFRVERAKAAAAAAA